MEFMHQTNAVKKATLQSSLSPRDIEHEASGQPLAENQMSVQNISESAETNKSGYYLYLF